MKKIVIALGAAALVLLALTAACSQTTTAKPQAPAEPDREKMWVDSVYALLTPRQRVAQLFMPHCVVADNEKGRAVLKKFVEGDGVGGLLLGKGDVASYARLNNYAQSLARVPLLIAADAEWGLAMRLSDAPRFPHNIALGAGDDTAAMRAYGLEKARELRRLGITVDFAPDVDVNINAANPVIGFRSLGEDPRRVARLASAFARGLKEGGVMGVAKHFPGHGDTSADSHKSLPTVDASAERLQRVELVPFKRLIDEGIDGVMVGHLNVPAIDRSGTPASLSPLVIDSLLKGNMGFGGLVFTDALEMQGAKAPGGNNSVAALKAGADVLLGSGAPSADIDAVMKALSDGRLNPKRVEASVRKLLAYKYRLGLTVRQTIASEGAKADLDNQEAEGVNRRLAQMAVTVVRNDDNLLPIDDGRPVSVVTVGGSADNAFSKAVKRLDPKARVLAAGAHAPKEGVVLAPVVSSGSEAVAALARLRREAGDRLVPIFLMNPYRIKAFAASLKGLPTLVVVGDDTPLLREYAAEGVMGAIPVTGRMAVSVAGVAQAGEGVSLTREILGRSSLEAAGADPSLRQSLDAIIDKGLSSGAFTGCEVMVIKDGQIVYDRPAGYTNASKHTPITGQTLFDVASVSKVAGTTAGLMEAYDRGLFSLDDKLERFLPELRGNNIGQLTFRELLMHETGLPATISVNNMVLDPDSYEKPAISKKRGGKLTVPIHEGYYANSDARLRSDLFSRRETDEFDRPVAAGLWTSEASADTLLRRIMAIQPGPKRYKYSDLNFVLLMAAEERMTGTSHDDWFTRHVAEPLGNDRTTYLPLDYFPASQVAATERDGWLRNQLLQGYVHDELAAYTGGVQGNAGLFANAEGLARWMQMLIDGGVYGDEGLLSKATVNTFLTTRSQSGRRGLGFDTALDGRFIGHTGFTGTAFWMSPRRRLGVIVLTNRVSPTRDNSAWKELDMRNRILQLVDTNL